MPLYTRRGFLTSAGALCASSSLLPGRILASTLPPTGTGYAFHPQFAQFKNNGTETYLRAEWINARLEQAGITADTVSIAPFSGNPLDFIRKVHSPEHIRSIQNYSSPDTIPISAAAAAEMAVAYILGAVDRVCSGKVRNAFCCIRPPGHHAENSGECGFCYYANVVIAARYARETFGIKKVMIVDWDFHHGNGTQTFLCNNRNTLFFDTFGSIVLNTDCDNFTTWQDANRTKRYTGPDFKFPKETTKFNVRMSAGATNDDFIRAFETILVSHAALFKPELVLISSGFDCKKNDALGNFNVTAKGISQLTSIVRSIAETYAGGKLVSILEGGYSDSRRDQSVNGLGRTYSGLSQCAENHVKTLLTGDVHPETPYFTALATISLYNNKQYEHTVDILDGVLTGISPEFVPFSLTVTKPNGQLVKTITAIQDTTVDFRLLGLVKGRYIVTLQGARKTIIKTLQL